MLQYYACHPILPDRTAEETTLEELWRWWLKLLLQPIVDSVLVRLLLLHALLCWHASAAAQSAAVALVSGFAWCSW